MRSERAAPQRNIEILSVRPAGMLPADRPQQAEWLLGAQAKAYVPENSSTPLGMTDG